MNRAMTMTVGAAALALLAGCGAGTAGQAAPTPTATVTETAYPTATATVTETATPTAVASIVASSAAPVAVRTSAPKRVKHVVTRVKHVVEKRVVKRKPKPRRHSVGYPNCTAARQAGVTPLYRGEPGYAQHLDRDNDGVACE